LHSAGLTTLLKAEGAIICIANTKNGTKGVVVHHEAFGGPICSVAALAHKVANLQSGTNMCTLDTVYNMSGCITIVMDCNIGIAVWWGGTYDGLMTKGHTLTRISSHSLRAGGGHGNEAEWSIRQYHHAGGAMDIADVLHLHPHANRGPYFRSGLAHEHGLHLPKRWV
jgi:hypothetical protein